MQTSYTGFIITSDLNSEDDIQVPARQYPYSRHIVPPLDSLSQAVIASLTYTHQGKQVNRTSLTYKGRNAPETTTEVEEAQPRSTHSHAQTSWSVGPPLMAASHPALLGVVCLGEVWEGVEG